MSMRTTGEGVDLRKLDGEVISSAAFGDCGITAQREIDEAVDAVAGGGPADLEPVELRGRAEPDHFARVVR